MIAEILGLTHECQDAGCHVPGFVDTLRRMSGRVGGEQTPDIEAAVRRAVTGVVCNVSNLPAPLQAPALGLGMGSLIDGLTQALAPVLAAAVREARAAEWLQGYEFALRNLQDEAVQADLQRLTAGVNAGPGFVSAPPDGADDAPDEAKGALAQQPPAPAVDYRADRIAVDAPEGGESRG